MLATNQLRSLRTYEMLTVEDIAAVKLAVEICTSRVKREILGISSRTAESGSAINSDSIPKDLKNQWKTNLENKTNALLENSGLTTCLQKKVSGLVLLTGMRMLNWATYHEGVIGFSRDVSINFLNGFLFTSRGIIDNKKTAEELMKCESLNVKQKYKLACLYCFDDQISDLFRQMPEVDQEEFYNVQEPKKIRQPPLIKFWSYFVMDDVDKLRGEKTIEEYLLDIATDSGLIAAVEHCLVRTEVSRIESTLMTAALGAIKNRIWQRTQAEYDTVVFLLPLKFDRDHSWVDWIPKDFFVDLMYFVFNKMAEIQQIEFLKQELCILSEDAIFKSPVFRVFTWFLNWPYQDFFMKAANLIWDHLPERDFASMLAEICAKIETKELTLKYCEYNWYAKHYTYVEDNTYDYRKLLKEFWCLSPQTFKRYIFSSENKRDIFISGCKAFLGKLLSLKDFTEEDRRYLELVLESATENEKINMILCEDGSDICRNLIKIEKWRVLNLFLSNCFTSQDQILKFKKDFSITKRAQKLFIYFAENEKWDAVESFVMWSTLSEEELNQLKTEMILSEHAMDSCMDIIEFECSVKSFQAFCEWFCTSFVELSEFKRKFVGCEDVLEICSNLVQMDLFEVVDDLITWCLYSDSEIREYKKTLASKWGCRICNFFMVGNKKNVSLHEIQWEKVLMFVTWCFSLEDEIRNFKRKALLEDGALDIHFNLILSCDWLEAETFISWLELSSDEIIELKKKSLYKNMHIFYRVMCMDNPEACTDYAGGKWEKIECILRWCLTDKEAILEFQGKYQEKYGLKQSHEEEWYKISDVHNS